jgi:hypothetical protein
MKPEKKIPSETEILSGSSQNISTPENQEIESEFHKNESQRRLELWQRGIIICDGPLLFEDTGPQM